MHWQQFCDDGGAVDPDHRCTALQVAPGPWSPGRTRSLADNAPSKRPADDPPSEVIHHPEIKSDVEASSEAHLSRRKLEQRVEKSFHLGSQHIFLNELLIVMSCVAVLETWIESSATLLLSSFSTARFFVRHKKRRA